MKLLFLSFVVGLGVGVLYGLIRVKSPAPPIVALLGLLGMVLGEQFGIWVQTKNSTFRVPHPRALSVSATTAHFTTRHHARPATLAIPFLQNTLP
jgi:XapX domain-containing protein